MADENQGKTENATAGASSAKAEPTIPLSWQVFTWQQWIVVLVGAFLLAQFIERPSFADKERHNQGQIVVVDMERILRAKSLSVAPGDTSKIAAEADSFAKKMKVEIDALTGRGIVVINTSQAVAWPKAADITEQLASRLGADMKLADEDDKMRALRLQQLIQARPQAPATAPAAPVVK